MRCGLFGGVLFREMKFVLSNFLLTENWPNLEKCPPFLQFLAKLSDFSLVKDLTNRVLLFTKLLRA
jgi:hypothetical protein